MRSIAMVIYKTTNLINNKIYIGQDSKNRPNYYGSGNLIKRAIQKYGKENFKKEILAWCFDKNHLDFLEKLYIEFFNSKIPNGYNIHSGGTTSLGATSSLEVRKKISVGIKEFYKNNVCHMIGKKLSEEIRRKQSISSKGKNIGSKNGMFGKMSPMRGKEHTEEAKKINREKHLSLWKNEDYRKKQSLSHTGYKRSEESRKKQSETIQRKRRELCEALSP